MFLLGKINSYYKNYNIHEAADLGHALVPETMFTHVFSSM